MLLRESALAHRARIGGPVDAAWRVVCLPHAGGSAGSYLRWGAAPVGTDAPRIVALQYPGHETRIREHPLESFAAVVDEFAQPLAALLADGVPTALLGHSFGASAAVALAGLVEVELLVLSGRAAPGLRTGPTPPTLGEDDAWRAWLRRLGGTPEEVLRDDDALRMAVRALRADLTAAADLEGTGEWAQRERSVLPVSALLTVAGRDDTGAGPAAVGAWAERLAPGAVDHGTLVLDGGHFALLDASATVLGAIAAAMGRRS